MRVTFVAFSLLLTAFAGLAAAPAGAAANIELPCDPLERYGCVDPIGLCLPLYPCLLYSVERVEDRIQECLPSASCLRDPTCLREPTQVCISTPRVVDDDEDQIPDFLESAVCSRTITADNIDTWGHAHCASNTDLALHPDTDVVGFATRIVTDGIDQAVPIVDLVLDQAESTVGLAVSTTLELVEDAEEAVEDAQDTVEDTREMMDGDEDQIPDALESAVCGRVITANSIDTGGHAHCASNTDLVLHPDTSIVGVVTGIVMDGVDQAILIVGLVLDEAGPVVGLAVSIALRLAEDAEDAMEDTREMVDADGDLVPEALEPTMCQVEDRNTPLDGSCSGNDYTP